MIDLTSKNITGKVAEKVLDLTGITCNKNMIPYDTQSPFITSGLRFGTPACTTRGFGKAEFSKVADIISEVLSNISIKSEFSENSSFILEAKEKIKNLCDGFSVY